MSHDARFSVSTIWPIPPGPEERDVAHIRIAIGDAVITRLADVNTNNNRDYVRASAVSLALWFADNWWRHRWEPLHDARVPSVEWRLRHELTAGPGGTLWPPLMIYGTGTRIVLSPPFGPPVSSGPIRFFETSNIWPIGSELFEKGLDEFFQTVIQHCSWAQDGLALRNLVHDLQNERADPDIAAWRRLEARLGYDPDEAPEDLINALSSMEDRLGEQAVEEAAMAAPGARAQHALEQVVAASNESQLLADFSVAEAVDLSSFPKLSRPWELGEAAAQKVREAIGIPEGPILGRPFADILKVEWETIKSAPATARNLDFAARLLQRGTSERLALQMSKAVDRRFELSRMIGDAIWTKNEPFGVISRANSERQRFQRAFAQSLLCPFASLHRRVDLSNPTEEQIKLAAKHFHVRPSVVQTLLVNKGVLPRETLAARLEAA